MPKKKPPILETERFTLRQLQEYDDQEIFALRSSESVNRYIGRKPSQSIEDARAFIKTIHKNNSLYWVITMKGADQLIGTISLFDFSADNLKAEIGYELLPEFQGRGIMQEALSKVLEFSFQQLHLKLIEACCNVENKSSIKLLAKLNFKTDLVCEGNLMMYKLTAH